MLRARLILCFGLIGAVGACEDKNIGLAPPAPEDAALPFDMRPGEVFVPPDLDADGDGVDDVDDNCPATPNRPQED